MNAARAEAEAGLREARNLVEQAFQHAAGYDAAHAELARIAAEGLRQALADGRDVLAPGSLAELEQELERHDRDGSYGSLRGHEGWVSLASDPPGARVTLLGEEAPLARTTPIERLVLPEGSYVALLEAEGRAPVCYPFLVRRAAVYEEAHPDGGARPARELAVELPRAGEVPEGFVFVPAGETLVADDPPRWESVASFLIQRHEVPWSAFLSLLHARERELGPETTLGPELPLRRSREGAWELAGVQPDWPVKGATPMQMHDWASWHDGRIAGAPRDWIAALPTRAEWVRAARGADGRSYPWGFDFDGQKCASYVWGPHYGRDADPVPIGSVPADVSPFGVLDLAGSVAEITADLHEPRPGEYVACGGSYWCDDPDDFRVTAAREDENDRPRKDVGFRLVLRPFPPELLPRAGPPEPFRDDFERPDSEEVGNGWLEFASAPLAFRTSPHEVERCSVEGGRLVCRGGMGSFSEASTAWHPIQVPQSGCVVRVCLRAACVAPAGGDGRWFGLIAFSDFRASHKSLVALTMSFTGGLQLSLGAPSKAPAAATRSGPPPTGLLLFELTLLPGRCEGWIHPVDEAPTGPPLELSCPSSMAMPSFVGLVVPNAVGARLEVEWVEVTMR
jgi:formylglycine-generating enzyme required for sulfatase activity